EATLQRRVARQVGVQHLERYLLAKVGLFSDVHLTHRAVSKRALDPKLTPNQPSDQGILRALRSHGLESYTVRPRPAAVYRTRPPPQLPSGRKLVHTQVWLKHSLGSSHGQFAGLSHTPPWKWLDRQLDVDATPRSGVHPDGVLGTQTPVSQKKAEPS